jgi:general secretion pathway protein A
MGFGRGVRLGDRRCGGVEIPDRHRRVDEVMYLDFYGLTELPFELTANPRFLLPAPSHREALSNLRYGIETRKALTLLIGEAGTGKTTLIRSVLSTLDKDGADVCSLSNPTLSRAEFVESLARGFGLGEEASRSKAAMLTELESALRARRAAGRHTALVVDEAQSLSDELLEEIRLLANIESDEGKLLPIILAGQPELSARLNRRRLRQIKQRIALRCELRPLDLHETAAFIAGRIRASGGDSARVFTREAVTLIHERSGGIPRTICVLCDNALVNGLALDRRPVTRELVLDVCRDFDLGVTHADPEKTEKKPAGVPDPPSPAIDESAVNEPVLAGAVPRRRFRFF